MEQEAAAPMRKKEAILFEIGEFCMLKARPCCILDYRKSKPGKHGHGKVLMAGIDLFTSRKLEDIFQSATEVAIPDVHFSEHRLAYIGKGRMAEFELEGEAGLEGLPLQEGAVEDCVRGMAKTGKEVTVRVMRVEREKAIVGARVSEE